MPVFKDRQNVHLAPIPAKGQQKVESIWKTADGKPGEYDFTVMSTTGDYMTRTHWLSSKRKHS